MRPFGFFAALLAADGERTRTPRRRPAEAPLPPIDGATLRAWRAWAHGDPGVNRATADSAGAEAAPVPNGAARPANDPA
jgi:hypothetical protein